MWCVTDITLSTDIGLGCFNRACMRALYGSTPIIYSLLIACICSLQGVHAGIVWVNAHHRNDPSSPWGGFKVLCISVNDSIARVFFVFCLHVCSHGQQRELVASIYSLLITANIRFNTFRTLGWERRMAGRVCTNIWRCRSVLARRVYLVCVSARLMCVFARLASVCPSIVSRAWVRGNAERGRQHGRHAFRLVRRGQALQLITESK